MTDGEDIIELEPEVLAESGNVMPNRGRATILNVLRRTLTVSLIEIVRGNGRDLLGLSRAPAREDVLPFLCIDFFANKRHIRGYIEMLMGLYLLELLCEISPVAHAAP